MDGRECEKGTKEAKRGCLCMLIALWRWGQIGMLISPIDLHALLFEDECHACDGDMGN